MGRALDWQAGLSQFPPSLFPGVSAFTIPVDSEISGLKAQGPLGDQTQNLHI
jgi:hypothetical protein